MQQPPHNPYQPPQNYGPPPAAAPQQNQTIEGYVPCPKCGSAGGKRPGFTWWGGVIGAKMLHHVKCDRCFHTYNGKSGGSNTGAIVIYSVVVGVIAIALFAAIESM